MNFELTEDQIAFAQTAKQFAEQELAPFAAQWDKDHHFPVEAIQKAGELGFCGLYTPEESGGLGLSRLDSSIIFEELSMGCTTTTAMLTIHNMATWMIATWGQQEVKDAWCGDLVTGQKLASYCLTEPGSGSDAASLKSTAKEQAGGYVLNGSKVFISGAGSTDVLVVMARTGEDGPKGVSAFAVPADAEGISYGKPEEKMGWNAQPTRMITFENVILKKSWRLGEEGQGFKMAMQGLDGGRINIATCSIGTAQQALNTARNYMQEREQFGKPIAAFQALQFKLADMATELVAARQMVRLAAFKLDNGDADKTTYCAMAKRFATDIGFKVCNEALQLHGGYGYIKEYPLERHVRDVRVHQILEGTNEIMRVIIGRRLISDEREIR
ncbi:acyl-CoA dehydrogenase family protein [Alteromonas sp. ASW11-130]|uniref:acyl-CoA dehydrogenase family protein n=1 Tax=Alteromonas sp. ASW11-130 TaxID=3015775 RepID=UPI002241BF86|nr:acyl-CoA dehydrogenase family protein [Alteromonas sp. ASW11-130]MCW8092216.1 acyl-CoA dehydrogenase family protein [Alteromonas sp. ASW11-130]